MDDPFWNIKSFRNFAESFLFKNYFLFSLSNFSKKASISAFSISDSDAIVECVLSYITKVWQYAINGRITNIVSIITNATIEYITIDG